EWASRAAVCRCAATSSRQRGHSRRCSSTASASSGSMASSAYAPRSSSISVCEYVTSRPHVLRDADCAKGGPHALEAGPDTTLDGTFRLIEHRGDLAVGVTAEVRQLDRPPL